MNNLHPIAQAVQSQGRGKDTQLVHMTPNEVQGLHALAKAHGGSLSVNPSTGLPEAGFLDSMLPTILGVGLAAATGGTSLALTPGMIGLGIGGLQYMRTGSLEKGLMAGLGAYGGAGLGTSLMGAGASGVTGSTAAQAAIDNTAAQTAVAEAAKNTAMDATTRAGLQATADASAKNLLAQQAQTAAGNTFGQNLSNIGGGLQSAFSDPTKFMEAYGGSGMDLAQYGGAALSTPLMDAMTPAAGPGYTPDNEQFQYNYNPNRATQEQIDAQRAAYAARGITGGEIDYFNPVYEGPNKVRVAQGGELKYAGGGIFGRAADLLKMHMDAQSSKSGGEGNRYTYDPTTQKYTRLAGGGLLSLAEGGMPNDYEYDPVSQTYKKVLKAPTAAAAPIGAVTPIGIAEDAGGDRTVERSNKQEQFLDWEENSPEGKAHRGERMQALQGLASMGPLGALANAVAGTKYQTPNFGTLIGTPQTFKDYQQTPEGSARTSEGESYSVGSGAFQDYSGMSQDDLAESGGGVGAAKGGLISLAAGGMSKGGFVVPADVVSALGNGSSDAGLRKLYALIGDVKPIKGNGDGLSDSIPTSIDGRQPARVADGEAYVNPKTVAKIGGGDAKKGAKKLYAMMDKIRQQAHGKKTQQRKVNAKAIV